MAIAFVQLGLALGLSFILISIIVGIANCIYWFGKKRAARRAASKPVDIQDLIVPPEHFILLRVLLDKNGHACLSTFQFLTWTLLISFLYVALWILHLLNGSVLPPEPISETLMILMGISIAVPLTSQGISVYKRSKRRLEGERYAEPTYSSMIEEDGKPSLLRLQMFLWTLVALVVYLATFLTAALSPGSNALSLGLPGVDPTLLFLMGLSQTGYLVSTTYAGEVKKNGKTLSASAMAIPAETQPAKKQETVPVAPGTAIPQVPVSQPLAIRDIIPRTVWHSEQVTLLGSGFGTHRDTIMLNTERIPDARIRRWEESRIEFFVPDTIPAGSYALRVIAGGSSIDAQMTISAPAWTRKFHDIDAEIQGGIWIDDPGMQGTTKPPMGFFITGKRYYFFYEYAVPPGTPAWGMTQFRTELYVDGVRIKDLSVLPGYINGNNIGVYDYVFDTEKVYRIEIVGRNKVSLDVEVKKGLS